MAQVKPVESEVVHGLLLQFIATIYGLVSRQVRVNGRQVACIVDDLSFVIGIWVEVLGNNAAVKDCARKDLVTYRVVCLTVWIGIVQQPGGIVTVLIHKLERMARWCELRVVLHSEGAWLLTVPV
jgi:hypothetical protein